MGKTYRTFESRERTLCMKKRKNNVAWEGIVEVGSSNEMSSVVLDQRVCTGRPLLERKNLRRSVGNCCLSRRWLRKNCIQLDPKSYDNSNAWFSFQPMLPCVLYTSTSVLS